jgi:nucleoid-associated protein YgaU
MSKLAAFLGANSGPILGVGVFAVGALGAGAYLGLLTPQGETQQARPTEVALPAPVTPQAAEEVAEPAVTEPAPVSEPEAEVAVVPDVEPEAESAPVVAEAEVTPEDVVEPEVAVILPRAPSIDEVRSEADGLTIVAGRGEPGADIILFVDNVENTRVQVGNDSAFAIVTFLDVTPNATVLSVVQRVGEIELVASDIILAPRVVAQVEERETAPATNDEPRVVTATETIAKDAESIASAATTAVIGTASTALQDQGEAVAALVDPIDPNPNGEAQEANDITSTSAAQADTNALEAADETPTTTSQAEVSEVESVAPSQEPAPEPTTEVAILKSDEDGVQVINRSSAPEVMSNVEIDTISYSEEGDVLLSGRAQELATSVRVYLNNTPVTVLEVDTSGRWRGDLPDVDTGIYTLRVDEVDEGGTVTSRVETPFKREAPEVLAAAAGTEDAPAKAITVQKGATLWAIARDRYGDGTLFVRVFEANADSIKDANLIYPGQVFDLPE